MNNSNLNSISLVTYDLNILNIKFSRTSWNLKDIFKLYLLKICLKIEEYGNFEPELVLAARESSEGRKRKGKRDREAFQEQPEMYKNG